MTEKDEVKILLIEDERKILASLTKQFLVNGFIVDKASTCRDALEKIDVNNYSLMILDINLPDGSGFDLLNNIRKNGNTTPVLILSARDKVEERILGLTSGADDYVVKPFDFGEILARVYAILNRSGKAPFTKLFAQDLEMDLITRKVKRGEKIIELSLREYELLEYFLRNKNQIITNRRFAEKVWGYTFDTGTNIVNVYMNYLRKAIDNGFKKRLIKTVRGKGFILLDE